jgi:hypothetical protein
MPTADQGSTTPFALGCAPSSMARFSPSPRLPRWRRPAAGSFRLSACWTGRRHGQGWPATAGQPARRSNSRPRRALGRPSASRSARTRTRRRCMDGTSARSRSSAVRRHAGGGGALDRDAPRRRALRSGGDPRSHRPDTCSTRSSSAPTRATRRSSPTRTPSVRSSRRASRSSAGRSGRRSDDRAAHWPTSPRCTYLTSRYSSIPNAAPSRP